MEIIDEGRLVKVDGNAFQKLSPNDRKTLLAPVKAARRAALKENLKEGGIAGEEYVNEMDAFDQMVFGDAEFSLYLQSIDGRAEIIARACLKANPDAKTAGDILDNLILDIDDDFVLAAKLAGFRIKSKSEVDGDGEGEPPKDAEKRPSDAGS